MEDIKAEIINTTKQVSDLVDSLVPSHAPPVPHSPIMYVDLEGVDLCREGSLSIFILLIDTGIPSDRVYLIDIHVLGAQAFNTTGVKGKTLKDILQEEKIPKVFFDVRNDSDALFTHFGVGLQGVEDVQLMESATRGTTRSRKFLNGLAKCVQNYVLTSFDKSGQANWKLAKEKGKRLFKAEEGGSYEVFNQRPIPEEIISYCVGDVQCLPELRDIFWKTRANQWQNLVREESKKRVAESQKSEYQPHGPDRAVAQWSEDQNRTLDQWNYVASDPDDSEEYKTWGGDDNRADSDHEVGSAQDGDNDRDDKNHEDWTDEVW